MPSATYEQIKAAIQRKQQITCDYNGYYRELCPHAIGHKNGIEQVISYQFGGESSGGLEPLGSPQNWRCMRVSGITNLQVQDGEWHSYSPHTRPQTCIDFVDAEVIH